MHVFYFKKLSICAVKKDDDDDVYGKFHSISVCSKGMDRGELEPPFYTASYDHDTLGLYLMESVSMNLYYSFAW